MKDIALQLGISQGHYSHLERGKRNLSDDLIKKIAEALGESTDVVATAAKLNAQDKIKLKSWMSNIRINGLPLTRAFAYHLESKGIVANALRDDSILRLELKNFIEQNISYAVIAEMTENKDLIPNLKMHLEKKEVMKEKTDHEQLESTK